MTPMNFWTLEGSIAAAGGVVAFLLAGPLNRILTAK
jgi:hypothetical protein